MRKTLIAALLVAPALLLANSSKVPATADEASKAIVGTWTQTCVPTGKPNQWASKKVVITKDLHAKGGMQFFSDSNCTKQTGEKKASYTFTFGKIAKGDDGKDAWEVNKLLGKQKKKMFVLIRFLDDKHVVVAAPTKTNDGTTPEKRKNHFEASWKGCVKETNSTK